MKYKFPFFLFFIVLFLSCKNEKQNLRALYQSGKIEEAKEACKSALENNPEDISALEILGEIFMKEGDLERAGVALDQAVELNPNNYENYLLRGNIFAAENNYEYAENYLREALKHNNKDYRIYFNLGQVLSNRDKFRESVNMYTKATEIKPDKVEIIQGRALAYEDLMMKDSAIVDYSNAIALDSMRPELYFLLGFIRYETGDVSTACIDFKKAADMGLEPANEMLLRCN